MSSVELKTSVLVSVLLHVIDRWAEIFRRISHECLAALYISRVSPLSWWPACARLIRSFCFNVASLLQTGKMDYPFAYMLSWFTSDKLRTYGLALRSPKKLGHHDDICPFFGISSFHISCFTWRSPKSFSCISQSCQSQPFYFLFLPSSFLVII
jgi:hypothetical protein